jgi:hypothetical protein
LENHGESIRKALECHPLIIGVGRAQTDEGLPLKMRVQTSALYRVFGWDRKSTERHTNHVSIELNLRIFYQDFGFISSIDNKNKQIISAVYVTFHEDSGWVVWGDGQTETEAKANLVKALQERLEKPI